MIIIDNLIDDLIEKIFKKYLYKQRNHHIESALKSFISKHSPDPKIIEELKHKLESEADRLYPLVDKSILRERIKRAKYTFWITAIASTITAAIILVLTHGSAIIFITPLCAALIAWLVTLLTVPISYNERIEGGMDSTVLLFEKALIEAKNFHLEQHAQNLRHEQMQEEIEALKNLVKDLNTKVEELSKQVQERNTLVEEKQIPLPTKPDAQIPSHFWKKSKPNEKESSDKKHSQGNVFLKILTVL